jgi:hypothetical protein
VDIVFNTSGTGYWSSVINAEIRITDIKLMQGTQWEDDHEIHGELRVYFDTETWDVNEHGLIYTDKLFIKQLREFLVQHGLPGDDVCYSEQGMQGNDYVSLDAGTKFYEAWMEKFGIAHKTLVEMY